MKEEVNRMFRCLCWPAVLLLAALAFASPALAANDTTNPSGDFQLTLRTTVVPPAPSAGSNPTELQLRPMQLATVPPYTGFDTTLLATQTQPLLQLERQQGGMNRHVQWAIYGAAIGLIVGLIDDDPIEKGLIGGVVGFGLSYVIAR
jgi:hypothetical protein